MKNIILKFFQTAIFSIARKVSSVFSSKPRLIIRSNTSSFIRNNKTNGIVKIIKNNNCKIEGNECQYDLPEQEINHQTK